MKILFYCLFIISLITACTNKDKIENPQRQTNKQDVINKQLVGAWNSDLTDAGTKNSIGKVTMTFTESGELIYIINTEVDTQILNLTYSISGDTIISNQPSRPQEEDKLKINLRKNEKELNLYFLFSKGKWTRYLNEGLEFLDNTKIGFPPYTIEFKGIIKKPFKN